MSENRFGAAAAPFLRPLPARPGRLPVKQARAFPHTLTAIHSPPPTPESHSP
jgi:hypothetical protein